MSHEAQDIIHEPQELLPRSFTSFSAAAMARLQQMEWAAADAEAMGLRDLERLPLHLRLLEYVIGTTGRRKWVTQEGITIPGSSVVQLYMPSGLMKVGKKGWPHPVDATGQFTNGIIMGPSSAKCPVAGVNQFCILVRTPSIWFKNPAIPHWGASVGDLSSWWEVGANEGGHCMVAFNDEWDEDNSGYLTLRIRILQGRTFMQMHRNLMSGR